MELLPTYKQVVNHNEITRSVAGLDNEIKQHSEAKYFHAGTLYVSVAPIATACGSLHPLLKQQWILLHKRLLDCCEKSIVQQAA